MIELTHLVLGPLETNCYFVRDTETGDLVIVDPAWYDPSLEGKVRAAGAGHVKGILLTHCHVDHIAGAAQLKAGSPPLLLLYTALSRLLLVPTLIMVSRGRLIP